MPFSNLFSESSDQVIKFPMDIFEKFIHERDKDTAMVDDADAKVNLKIADVLKKYKFNGQSADCIRKHTLRQPGFTSHKSHNWYLVDMAVVAFLKKNGVPIEPTSTSIKTNISDHETEIRNFFLSSLRL